MSFNYPLMLDVATRPILVVGGGNVAARKAKLLLECGATKIRIVAPEFSGNLPPGPALIQAPYASNHLDGISVAFAATDDAKVNDQVVSDCRARGILVCRADPSDESSGDFATPALLRKGAVTVTVSAGSPALATLIRDSLANLWDRRWTDMAAAMQILRPEILASPLQPHERTEVFRDLGTPAALDILAAEGIEGLRSWLIARYPNFA